MIPGIIVRLTDPRGIAGNAQHSIAACYREEGREISWFVFENGAVVPIGWGVFLHRMVAVGYSAAACANAEMLDVDKLTVSQRQLYFREDFSCAWPKPEPSIFSA